MEVRRAYCSAVDHNVPVMLRSGAPTRDRISLHDPADLVCLDYKVRCTGWCCPLFSVEADLEPTAIPAEATDAGTPASLDAGDPPPRVGE